jgi:hypothetical protein
MRIFTTAVIREDGIHDVYVNGLLNEEMKKMKEDYEKQLSVMEAKLQAKTGHLNKNLSRDLMAVKVMVAKPTSLIERIRERIVITWCQIWGIGLALKFWTDNED